MLSYSIFVRGSKITYYTEVLSFKHWQDINTVGPFFVTYYFTEEAFRVVRIIPRFQLRMKMQSVCLLLEF